MITRLKQILSGSYIRNVGWVASAEFANRIIRLVSTVILARMFSSQDYGLLAIVYTLSDFFQVFTLRGSVGAKIIQADEQDVGVICNTAYWLNWFTSGTLFMLQCLVALALPYFSKNHSLTLPLIAVAFTYLGYPLFVIHLSLIERENRFKAVAGCNVVTSLVSNVLIAIFALLNWGIWAVIFSILLTLPVWVIFTWRCHPWRPPTHFSLNRWQEILRFGGNLLGHDLLNRTRSNIDYLIVGHYLGIEALGMYYFAFNAGSGITISLLYTFTSPLYPYICAVRNDYWQFRERYFNSLKKVSLILIPIILLQASLAPIYVPIVFGRQWIPAIPILILVSLSVIPRIYDSASALLLNAIDKTQISLRISILFTVVFILAILSTVQNGIYAVAIAVLLSHLLVLLPMTLWSNRFALRKEHFYQ